jgi:hypothetical protein
MIGRLVEQEIARRKETCNENLKAEIARSLERRVRAEVPDLCLLAIHDEFLGRPGTIGPGNFAFFGDKIVFKFGDKTVVAAVDSVTVSVGYPQSSEESVLRVAEDGKILEYEVGEAAACFFREILKLCTDTSIHNFRKLAETKI